MKTNILFILLLSIGSAYGMRKHGAANVRRPQAPSSSVRKSATPSPAERDAQIKRACEVGQSVGSLPPHLAQYCREKMGKK